MTNTEIIQAIRNEIERLKTVQLKRIQDGDLVDAEPYDKNEAYNELLSFLDTIESETTYDTQQYTPRPSVGIDDVARVQFSSHAKVFDKKRKAVFDWEQFKEVAGIFYGFGKKDHSDTLKSEKPMNQKGLEREIERCLWQLSDDPSNEELRMFALHFYDLGCRRTAEKYDEIEYNRQRAEESVPKDLEEAAEISFDEAYALTEDYRDFLAKGLTENRPRPIGPHWFCEYAKNRFIAGSKWDRSQMMKEAVEGIVTTRSMAGNIVTAHVDYRYKDGQKVRVIIVNED